MSKSRLPSAHAEPIDRWAVCVAVDDARLVAPLIGYHGVTACREGNRFWLQGKCLRDDERDGLARFTGGEKFRVLPDGQLVPWLARIPKGNLPDGPWSPAYDLWQPFLPTAAIPMGRSPRAKLRIVPDDRERACNLLLTTQARWTAFVKTCAQVRLAKWSFAASADGRVLVRGTPLPPVPGTLLVEQSGIAIEAGATWSPAVSSVVVREALQVPASSLGLLFADGRFEIVPGSEFVTATRTAVAVAATANQDSSRDEPS